MRPNALSIGWLALAFILTGTGCAKGPRPIAFDSETCSFCRMTISDPRFAAEWVTEKGKVHPFDSIECLAAFNGGPTETQGARWVADFNKQGEWLRADKAFYIRSPLLRSPMGLNLAAFRSRAEFEKAKGETRGAELRWNDVLLLVRTSGFAGSKEK